MKPCLFILSGLAALAFYIGCGGGAPSPSLSSLDSQSDVLEEGTQDSQEEIENEGGRETIDTPLLDDGFEFLDLSDTLNLDELAVDTTDSVDSSSEDTQVVDCGPLSSFDWHCEPGKPETCPGGTCLYGLCLAPVFDPDRWASCGDGLCDVCERSCPADCTTLAPFTGEKRFDDEATIVVWVHGWTNQSVDEFKKMTFGAQRSCTGGVFDALRSFSIVRPCGDTPQGEVAPNQFAKMEYYGELPPAWMAEKDRQEIAMFPWDSEKALHRYALILAKFLRHKADISGARYFAIACHSFGCLITRYMIEHNLENLASENRIVRWVTSAGVIAGARLARWATNPTVVQIGDLLGIKTYEFVVMNPDFVMDEVAWWDHRNYEGNSPYLKGILIHHVTSSDPHIRPALNMPLVDIPLLNPNDEPNDGIMFTSDQFFHSQNASGVFVTPDGTPIPATHSVVYAYHEDVPDCEAMQVMAVAGLFHRRKVQIRLAELELLKDRENHSLFDGEHGVPPAEVALEVSVAYDKPVSDVYGHKVVVHEVRVEHRTAEVITVEEHTSISPNLMVFEGPVFDSMTSLDLKVSLLEVDWYPRYKIQEWAFDADQELASFSGAIEIRNGTIEFSSEYARAKLAVTVQDLY